MIGVKLIIGFLEFIKEGLDEYYKGQITGGSRTCKNQLGKGFYARAESF
jgi:hypothetical protein